MKEGRKPEHPEKTSNDELQKMPHTKKPEDSSPKGDSNPHNSIGGRVGKQTVTPRVAHITLPAAALRQKLQIKPFYLTHSLYTSTIPSTDLITPCVRWTVRLTRFESTM